MRSRKIGNRGAGAAMQHDQATAVFLQRIGELDDGLANELDAAVAPRQRFENLSVEDKHAIDGTHLHERAVQRRVIEVAQVAAKPDQGARVAGSVGKRRQRGLRKMLSA